MRLLARLIALSKGGRLGGGGGGGAAPATFSSSSTASAAAAPWLPWLPSSPASVRRAAAAWLCAPTSASLGRRATAATAAATTAVSTRGFAADAALSSSRRRAGAAAAASDDNQQQQQQQQQASLEELVALAEGVADSLAAAVAAERASGNGGGRRRRLRQRASSSAYTSASSSRRRMVGAGLGDNVYRYAHPVNYYAPVRLPVHALGGGLPAPRLSSSSSSSSSSSPLSPPAPPVVVGRAELPGDVFAVPVRLDVLHRVVRWQMAARQQGTHKAKDRSEVSGGGRKPWRQKGTGRARQGSTRAPQWRGGGAAHGPVPRSHAHRLPKKVRRLGLKCALSAKAAEGRLLLVDTLNPAAAAAAAGTAPPGAPPKTRVLAAQLSALLAGQPRLSALLVDADKGDDADGGAALRRAAGNLPGVDVVPARGCNVASVLRRDVLVLTPAAAALLAERLRAPVNRLGASGRTQARRMLALRAAQARAAGVVGDD